MAKIKAVIFGIAVMFMSAIPAFASTQWYETVTLDTTAITAIAANVLAALAVIWTIRKAVKLTNSS